MVKNVNNFGASRLFTVFLDKNYFLEPCWVFEDDHKNTGSTSFIIAKYPLAFNMTAMMMFSASKLALFIFNCDTVATHLFSIINHGVEENFLTEACPINNRFVGLYPQFPFDVQQQAIVDIQMGQAKN
uniref:Uncharacterized protein n=1 Tax=Romanomermis culicivorax TaxID=13658 RepID=A0A915HZ59_ROMCU